MERRSRNGQSFLSGLMRPIRWLEKSVLRLHRDQSGSISIVSVFAFIFLAMVLGMVINIGRHANRKVKIQNAADSITYSGGTVMARGMNTLAFTNHLMCDVFALTAYLREARDRNAESMVDPILDAWRVVASDFRSAPLPKMSVMTYTIPAKVPREKQMIKVFSDQNAAVSEKLLPVMETILELEMIPEFQRALVPLVPDLANEAANEIASRHSPRGAKVDGDQGIMGMMWRTEGVPFGTPTVSGFSELPVADPIYDFSNYRPLYFDNGVRQRQRQSQLYLGQLNHRMLAEFDAPLCSLLPFGFTVNEVPESMFRNGVAKMSQFGNLWRGFTRLYLRELLEVEYPDRNIPYALRIDPLQSSNPHEYIERDFMYVGVAYWKLMEERMPGLFTNPLNADSVGFAQCHLHVPLPRLVKYPQHPPERQILWLATPLHRDLMNQNWCLQLVPATSAAIPGILQTQPPQFQVITPNLGGISVDDFRRLNNH